MSEGRESRRVWWIAGGALVALVALRWLPEVDNPLAPEPVAAYVAVLAEGDEVATDGAHELAAGRSFRLFAVLAAKDWRGDVVWFSAAPALRLGGREVPRDAIRPWPGDSDVKVRWFTVEGFAPVLEVATTADLERFRLNDNFHPEWGDRWSVAGLVDPRLAMLDATSPLRPLSFGSQRYAVRIELFDAPAALTPKQRVASPGAEAVLAAPGTGTTVVAALPPPLARLSASFGVPELVSDSGLELDATAGIARLTAAGLAFERPPLLAAHLAESGVAATALAWQPIDLAAERPPWGSAVDTGDLLQAGPRVVVLFRDAGEAGRLDPADLVFDLWQGLRIRRIDEVFRGERGLELELAVLAAARAGG
jgi:hypothetical protein